MNKYYIFSCLIILFLSACAKPGWVNNDNPKRGSAASNIMLNECYYKVDQRLRWRAEGVNEQEYNPLFGSMSVYTAGAKMFITVNKCNGDCQSARRNISIQKSKCMKENNWKYVE